MLDWFKLMFLCHKFNVQIERTENHLPIKQLTHDKPFMPWVKNMSRIEFYAI